MNKVFQINNAEDSMTNRFQMIKDVVASGQAGLVQSVSGTTNQVLVTGGSDGKMTLALTPNVTVSGSLSTPAFTLNQPSVSGNVMTCNASGQASWGPILPLNNKFSWSSYIHGDPSVGGIIQGTKYKECTYDTTATGLLLCPVATGKIGCISWDISGFDFTKDFEIEASIYMGPGADGLWITAGGSTHSGASGLNSTPNNSIGVMWETYYSRTSVYRNGVRVGTNIGFRGNVGYVNEWVFVKMRVITVKVNNTTQRYMYIYGPRGVFDNSLDVTSWVPGGTFVSVGAYTGGLTAAHHLNYIGLKYI